MPPTPDDYHWLVSPDAAAWLADTVAMLERHGLVSTTTRLRNGLSPTRAQLILQQCEMRRRAGEKFSHAQRMFFTDLGLQQSSSETIARYKASRFPAEATVFDLCCGIGGDLLSLAERGAVVCIERDSTTALFAAANCASLERTLAEVRCADATTFALDATNIVHIDPDRRPGGHRSTRIEHHEPSDEFLATLMRRCAGGALKLAPACDVPPVWQSTCSFEWISEQGECKQQVAWFGSLAQRPGVRIATAIRGGASTSLTIDGDEPSQAEIATSLRRFIFEPDAAVIAARLVDALAARHHLLRIDPQVAYLTSDTRPDAPLLAAFEIIEAMPLDVKRLKAALRAGGYGRLEVKKRGVDVSPEQLRRKLKVEGDNQATLLLTPQAGKTLAVIARRCGS
jgi:hypothetical protein